ncbi:hypothetical protein [Pseudomonas ficuserectae]|uniref:hypothetical protein n=1 Tax=Pseudomonas ficuserectae TaxID=53410 RepID=UPI0006D627B4|nr:hypothetical protein [Pseudomonas ficuserectae]KPX33051.1 hypothetical protein ALO69_200023 [Pseudomonas ficuserectae]RMS31598.1 hypothetical protein ALP68_03348 [Pseudomonas ficuserectae]RMS32312.1 hypothetical protein ALP67_03537 [Pseudomonas ficuserectae]
MNNLKSVSLVAAVSFAVGVSATISLGSIYNSYQENKIDTGIQNLLKDMDVISKLQSNIGLKNQNTDLQDTETYKQLIGKAVDLQNALNERYGNDAYVTNKLIEEYSKKIMQSFEILQFSKTVFMAASKGYTMKLPDGDNNLFDVKGVNSQPAIIFTSPDGKTNQYAYRTFNGLGVSNTDEFNSAMNVAYKKGLNSKAVKDETNVDYCVGVYAAGYDKSKWSTDWEIVHGVQKDVRLENRLFPNKSFTNIDGYEKLLSCKNNGLSNEMKAMLRDAVNQNFAAQVTMAFDEEFENRKL